MSASPVELRGLSLSYAGAPVLSGVDLDVPPGERLALLGPSGAGKTTLMRMVAGLLHPDAGDIRIDGRSVLDVPAERREVVLVFQDPLLFPHLSVADNVGFGLDLRRVPRAQRQQRIADALEQVQLAGLERRRPQELSGGQRQRVALARALVLRPRVLLLDEPLSNLDPELRADMRELLLGLHARHGTTTLLVTHDQEEALTLATRIALLLEGRILQVGPGQDFYERPATPAVARFFGAANLFAAEWREGVLQAPFGPLPVVLPPGTPPPAPGWVRATIRPEHILLEPGGWEQGGGGSGPGVGGFPQGGGSAPGTLPGLVRSVRFRGTHCELDVTVGAGQLRVVTLPGPSLAPGDAVRLTLPPERIHLFGPRG